MNEIRRSYTGLMVYGVDIGVMKKINTSNDVFMWVRKRWNLSLVAVLYVLVVGLWSPC